MSVESQGLLKILNGHFNWNKSRMSCFVGMLMALIQVRSVNLVDLSCGFESKAKKESSYKRMQRFFRHFSIDLSRVARWVLSVFGLDEPVWLSMDRTNWCWGKSDINILMLSVVYKGIALPVFWSLLDKRGNSNTEERIDLVNQFIQTFGQSRIAGLLADREFIGTEWFGALKSQNLGFCIRLKKNTLASNAQGQPINIVRLFRGLKIKEQRVLRKARMVWGHPVYLSALRLDDGELLIVACDSKLPDPIGHYGKRWEIETLFGCLKSRGFNFEDTHLVHPERIGKLLVLLTVAFVWAHLVGQWKHEEKPIPVKKHGRKAQSWFRYGLDILREILLNPIKKKTNKSWNRLIRLLCSKL